MELFQYKAEVIRVVDGDTLDASVDLGFDTWKKVRIRFQGKQKHHGLSQL